MNTLQFPTKGKGIRLILFLLLLGIVAPLKAQQRAEYFINVDPGFGAAESLSLDENLEAELILSITDLNLSAGLHQIGFRVQNDSLQWGITKYQAFYIPNNRLNQTALNNLVSVNYSFKSAEQVVSEGEWFFSNESDSLEVEIIPPVADGFLSLNARVVNGNGSQSFRESAAQYVPNISLQQDSINQEPNVNAFLLQSKSSRWLVNATDSLATDTLLALSEFEPGLQQLYATAFLQDQEAAFSGYQNFSLAEDLFLAKATAIYPADESIYVPIDTLISWQKVDEALMYQLQIGTEGSLQTILVDTLLAQEIESFSLNTTFIEKGTTYFWRVRALGDKVNSPWIDWQQFTTKRAIPAISVLLSPQNDSIQVSILPTLKWQKNERARSYQLQLALDSLFQSQFVVDSLGIADSLLLISDSLAYDTAHFWRVRAENESGIADWSTTNVFKSQVSPPNNPVLALPENGLTNTTTSVRLSWQKAEFAEKYDLQIAQNASFQNVVATYSNVEDSTVLIEDLAHFTNYYWRVRSVNATAASNWSSTFSFKTRPFIAPLASSPSVSALSASPDVSISTAYRLVSLPGNYEQLTVSSVFADVGQINEDWMVYTDNGAEQNYLVSQQNQALCFEPGKALWYLSKEAVNLDYVFSEPKVSDRLELVIPLRNGWNLIGSPFNQEVYPWSVVRQTNNISQPIWDYQGRWLQAESLTPLKGYYFFNDLGLDSLRLPLVGLSINNKEVVNSLSNVESGSPKVLSLAIKSSTEKATLNSSVQWNLHEQAVDIPMPMQDFDEQKLWIEKPRNTDSETSALSRRMAFLWQKKLITLAGRRAVSANESMLFEANYEINEGVMNTKVHFELSSRLKQKMVKEFGWTSVLVSFSPVNSHQLIAIESLNQTQLAIGTATTGKISLRFGNENELESYLADQVPTSFEIARIYPNPFNPTTTIRLNVAEAGLIHIQVFDLTGRKLATIVEQNLASGTHQFTWNAAGFASGIYWVKAIAVNSGQQLVQKITLMR